MVPQFPTKIFWGLAVGAKVTRLPAACVPEPVTGIPAVELTVGTPDAIDPVGKGVDDAVEVGIKTIDEVGIGVTVNVLVELGRVGVFCGGLVGRKVGTSFPRKVKGRLQAAETTVNIVAIIKTFLSFINYCRCLAGGPFLAVS